MERNKGMSEHHPLLGRYVIPDMPSTDELTPYLRMVDQHRWYSNFGPMVGSFEQRLLAHLTPANPGIHLVTLMTCYHALQIGLQLFHLPANASVLVPAVTFPACPLAVFHAGLVPVLADIDADTWQLTPETARAAARHRPVHAVMPVAVYGVPVDVEAWDRFSEETKIPVIIDAAAAFEVQAVPRHGLVAYSLHATKPFCVGEGGLLAGRNAEWIEEARCRSNFGTQQRIALYDGSNAKMSEYHAAAGLAQLDRWTGIKQRRARVLQDYREALARANLGVTVQKNLDEAVVSAFLLQSPAMSATKITNALNAHGIMAHRMYLPPLYHHPHFSELAVVDMHGHTVAGSAAREEKSAIMKNSEMLHQSLFGMPFHAFLEKDDVAFAVQTLAEILGQQPAAMPPA